MQFTLTEITLMRRHRAEQLHTALANLGQKADGTDTADAAREREVGAIESAFESFAAHLAKASAVDLEDQSWAFPSRVLMDCQQVIRRCALDADFRPTLDGETMRDIGRAVRRAERMEKEHATLERGIAQQTDRILAMANELSRYKAALQEITCKHDVRGQACKPQAEQDREAVEHMASVARAALEGER